MKIDSQNLLTYKLLQNTSQAAGSKQKLEEFQCMLGLLIYLINLSIAKF